MNKFFMKFAPLLVLIVSIITFLLLLYTFIKATTLIELIVSLLFVIVSGITTYVAYAIYQQSKGD